MTREKARTLVDKEGNYLGNTKVSLDYRKSYNRFHYKCKEYKIHRVVALAYGDKSVENMDVHHIDGDKLNNNIDNLVILTKQDHSKLHQMEGNGTHFKKGRVTSPETRKRISDSNKGRVVSEKTIQKGIYERLRKRISIKDIEVICDTNYLIKDIAKMYKMCTKTVVKIRNRKSFYINIFTQFMNNSSLIKEN